MLNKLVAGQPLTIIDITVEPHHANALGHLAAAQYIALFDAGFMAFIEGVGLTDATLRHGGATPVLRNLYASYVREVKPGDRLAITSTVRAHDAGQVRVFLEMRRNDKGTLVSTCDLDIVNLDIATRRPAPWSATQLQILTTLADAHAAVCAPQTNPAHPAAKA